MRQQLGFSLIELSIVLIVMGMLFGASITPLAGLRENAKRQQSLDQLQAVKQALIGYVIRTGVLPCPASPRNDPHNEICSHGQGGVPAAQVGLLGAVDSAGALLDPWGRPLRYALTLYDHADRGLLGAPDWSSPGEIAAVGISQARADLRLCLSRDQCNKQHLRADQLVAIVISDGSDGSDSGAQRENQDGDTQFALASYSQKDADRFDDMLVTLSRSDMAYWLLQSHWLGNTHPVD